MNNQSLVTLKISDIAVRQDAEGRYCLNDLHKSAGGEQKHQPANWIRLQQTTDLIDFLISEESTGEIAPIVTKQGVGTFSSKELVYAYAMWISAKFHIAVIRAYDQLQKPQYGLKSLASPFISEAEAARFQKSIKAHCAYNGKKYSDCYTTVYGQYGITKYTHIPAGKLEESARLIGMKLLPLKKQAIPAEPLKLEFTPEELEDLVAERIKSVAGEIMPKQHEEAVQHNSVTISLAPLVDGKHRRWLVTQALDEMTIMQSIRPDQDLRSKTEVLIDVGASKDALKELINQHIPDESLLYLINLASERLGNHIQYLKINSAVAA
jgi:KilA-N domain